MTSRIPPGQPEIFTLEPRGIQRGVTAKVKLTGTNLAGITDLVLHNPKLQCRILDEPTLKANEAWIQITAATNVARGAYELSVKNTNNESSKLKIYVDDLPQIYQSPSLPVHSAISAFQPPFSFWGTLTTPGKDQEIEFQAHAGDTLVFDLAAKSLGSKANAILTLMDDKGRILASDTGLDAGDPLLAFSFERTGRYRLQISDKVASASKEHFYRLSVGSFPVVTGCFPLGISANKESEVQLIGLNLGPNSIVHLKPNQAGEMEVPIDQEKFRSRRDLKVLVTTDQELIEAEPNDMPVQAMQVPVPCTINGRIYSGPESKRVQTKKTNNTHHATGIDTDLFQFDAQAGEPLIIETDAARRGSPLDTKIEILDSEGKPVERLVLQGVRDSHINFKNIDSNTEDIRVENWQEMELNQFMYLSGEVCRIFRMPQGPDSGFQFYNAGGKRLDYFDTSPIAHALDEPVYIVEPHPPGAKLLPNGLPIFTLYFANDDDASRKLGSDSRLVFDPPKSRHYFVRLADSRGFSGERYAYRLTIRHAKPDFNVTLNGANTTVNAGSGKEFSISAERLDGFDGDITVSITNVPPGFFVSTPVVIQAGHLDARGTINAEVDAAQLAQTNLPPIKVTASAALAGPNLLITKDVNTLGRIKLAEKPKLFVALEPYDESQTNFVERKTTQKLREITIAPGQTIPAWLKVKRNGHDDLVTFTLENLPHGIIVDNIGLNGVLIAKGQDARQIFLTAAKWVPETDRLCFAKAAQADTQTSLPVLLHVRRPPDQEAR